MVMRKFHPKIVDGVAINLEEGLDFQTWHHYCFQFTTSAQFPYPGGYINLTNKAFMDGILVAKGDDRDFEIELIILLYWD